MPAMAERDKLPRTSSAMLTRSGVNGHHLERQREEHRELVIKRPSMLAVPALLLTTLEELTEEQLKTFQSHLTTVQLPDCPPIPENADRQETVDHVVKIYGPERAMKITLMILKPNDPTVGQALLRSPSPSGSSSDTGPSEEGREERVLPAQRVVEDTEMEELTCKETTPTVQSTEDPVSNSLTPTVQSTEDPVSNSLTPAVQSTEDPVSNSLTPTVQSAEDPVSNSLTPTVQSAEDPVSNSLTPTVQSAEDPWSSCSVDLYKEFTPDILDHDGNGTYRFQCPSAGLFQCSITGLVFRMKGEGDVFYRTVHWDMRLLAQKCKRPAGPLFKFTSLKGSVCQLHLPHCEIRGNKGGCDYLSVAHVTDDNIEFIPPLEITDTHVIINITGFCGYGNVNEEDAPMSPINGLVLSFFKPAHDLYVLLLPRNVVLDKVEKKWKDRGAVLNLTPPDCELTPNQTYSLSGDPVRLIQPKTAKFVNFKEYENYTAAFQVKLQAVNIHLTLNKNDTSFLNLRSRIWNRDCMWERSVEFQFSPTEVPSSVTPPVGTKAGTPNVHFLLMDTLEELGRSDLKKFQFHLTHDVDDPISRSQLEDADRLVTVDRMVQSYCDEGAVKITLEILRKMGQNKLADELEKKFPNNV